MIITTAGRTSIDLISKAKRLASSFGLSYKDRKGVSVDRLKEIYHDDIAIVGKDRLVISTLANETNLFFHPNLAMIRAKRIFKGEEEPFIKSARLTEGMSVLDCTLGLASDSIIASIAVGESGSVTGIEGNHTLYFLAKEGLSSFSSGHKLFDEAMRKVKVIHQEHFTYLQQAKSDSIDVIYFDPMFESAIENSDGINAIRKQVLTTEITPAVIAEAKRVAKQRIILKDHWKSERFDKLGFIQHKRKTSLFHYGTIEINV
ncbi:class I SAM-dependent methyltransferase [Ornithinibacillus xuwenensis]|uniref:Class I SAM-dependent methyltransferase n=1 Tax=Ornithinibacillus xuwenensis TaxID=3144668 RepID=A0ABU9XF38_9BACI